MVAPRRGDLVWLSFDPQAGHEQAGRRPALTISPLAYNQRVGLALFCPITSQAKGYPLEVALSAGGAIGGVVLADQLKSLDWRARHLEVVAQAEPAVLDRALELIDLLVGGDSSAR